jgi:nucleolar MIF4G domain-containing protein 1
MSPDAADNDDAGKQPLNLLVLISELYNFQVISCRIIYDIVRELIDALATQGPAGEFAVEALLKIVRSECERSQSESAA